MARRDGAWLVQLEGHPDVSTDDLTLDELEIAEKACGVPYTLMDPHVSVRIAKALFAVMVRRALINEGVAEGVAEERALQQVRKLTTRSLHGAFTYLPPTDPQPASVGGGDSSPPSSAATSNAG